MDSNCYPEELLMWCETNMDHNRLIVKIDDKSKVTVVATISTAITKLPLLFITKGITQLGDVFNHWKTHSERGWINN